MANFYAWGEANAPSVNLKLAEGQLFRLIQSKNKSWSWCVIDVFELSKCINRVLRPRLPRATQNKKTFFLPYFPWRTISEKMPKNDHFSADFQNWWEQCYAHKIILNQILIHFYLKFNYNFFYIIKNENFEMVIVKPIYSITWLW